jgi:hypothetical protein
VNLRPLALKRFDHSRLAPAPDTSTGPARPPTKAKTVARKPAEREKAHGGAAGG